MLVSVPALSVAYRFCGGGRNLFGRRTGVLHVRLSPKSVFIGLVALGLPISMAIGWTLAPQTRRPAAVDTPARGGLGAGGIGAAPGRVARPDPVTAVEYSPQPAHSAAS